MQLKLTSHRLTVIKSVAAKYEETNRSIVQNRVHKQTHTQKVN